MKRKIRLLVFTKTPVPGTVKTRLIPRLGVQGATLLHEWLVYHTLDRVVEALGGSVASPVELWCAPSTDHPFFGILRNRFPLDLKTQDGKDLGERLANAVAPHIQSGRSVIVIGTDCPGISPEFVQSAVRALEKNDAVLGPAEDGGYVLLGLNRFDRSVFQGIEWGTDVVYRQTCDRLATLGWSWDTLAGQRDLDRPEDLGILSRMTAGLPGFLTGETR